MKLRRMERSDGLGQQRCNCYSTKGQVQAGAPAGFQARMANICVIKFAENFFSFAIARQLQYFAPENYLTVNKCSFHTNKLYRALLTTERL